MVRPLILPPFSEEVEAAYNISRRIEAEERALDAADLVFVSTQEEIEEQVGIDPVYRLFRSADPVSTGRSRPGLFVTVTHARGS